MRRHRDASDARRSSQDMQGALTVITRIAPGRTESLRSLLNGIGDAVESNELVPFVQMNTVHFARWVILPERRSDADNATFPAQLVLSTSYDGPLDTHLEELVRVARRGFDSIYEHCVGYPDAEGRTSASVLAYLRSHAVDHAIFYVGAPGVSLSRVHEESRLRNSIEEFLDRASVNTDGWICRQSDLWQYPGLCSRHRGSGDNQTDTRQRRRLLSVFGPV